MNADLTAIIAGALAEHASSRYGECLCGFVVPPSQQTKGGWHGLMREHLAEQIVERLGIEPWHWGRATDLFRVRALESQ